MAVGAEAALQPRQAGFRGKLLKNYVIVNADEPTLSAGRRKP